MFADGIGQVAGSALSGRLSEVIGVQSVALVAGSMCLLCLALNALLLPPSPVSASSQSSGGLQLTRVIAVVAANRKLLAFLAYTLTVGVGVSLFTSQYPIMLQQQYNLTPSELGQVNATSALMGVCFGAVILPWLLTQTIAGVRITEQRLLGLSSILFAACLPVIASQSAQSTLYITLVPFACASSIMYTVSSAIVSNLVR